MHQGHEGIVSLKRILKAGARFFREYWKKRGGGGGERENLRAAKRMVF
jgi:hypothetical protein